MEGDRAKSLRFLGGAGTVTGSKYLIRVGRRQVLLDCGLFQGLKELRLRNWDEFPYEPARIDAVVLSHAHLDHSGYLPRLVRAGFRGKVFCSSATAQLVKIVLLDAAHLQEEEAESANRNGYSKHKPALPLYRIEDAEAALKHLRPYAYGQTIDAAEGIQAVLHRAGHILGSSIVELRLGDKADPVRLVFSGDLGRWNQPILRDPELLPQADVLLLESTYGDRVHPSEAENQLAKIVNETVGRGGTLVIPAFAIGRTQYLIWMLRDLEQKALIPSLPVYIDSPMAIDVSEIYAQHAEEHDLDLSAPIGEDGSLLSCRQTFWVRSWEQSQALQREHHPRIIIAGSGMATGGRVLQHLRTRLPDERNTVLLVGYQASGTRGRMLQEGARSIRMFGQEIPVRARVQFLDGCSAHADREDVLKWLAGFKQPPKQTFLVHGETPNADGLAELIRARLGWNARPALDGEEVELTK